MRVKEVKIEEQRFRIGSLTVEEVEEAIENPLPESATVEQKKELMYKRVCQGLNNADRDQFGEFPDGFKPWDKERVRKAMDHATLFELVREILAFSGFEHAKESKPGESPAVAESSISISSAAASLPQQDGTSDTSTVNHSGS